MGLSAGPLAASPASASSSHPLIDGLEAAHQGAKANFSKIAEVHKNFSTVRSGLDSLSKLGEAVSAEDVVEELGKLVAAGLSPEPLIAMMAGDPASGQAPMPEGGPALQAWVQGMEQKFGGQEAKLGDAHAQAQHQLGVSAAKVLLAHHIADKVRGGGAAPQAPQASPPPQGPPNPLT